MSYALSSDVGGTFTDLVVADDQGVVGMHKVLTTPDNQVNGILAAISAAASASEVTESAFLAACRSFSNGSTVATNALIERSTARVGLICTKGHGDVLLFREGGKENPFDWDLDYPEPFVPRHLTIPVTERIARDGSVVLPLDEAEVRSAIKALRELEVEAIAVAYLWAFQYPAHEVRTAELIEEEWPGVDYSLSHQVSPIAREYRRTVACAMDASLRPLLTGYLERLEDGLREAGFEGSLRVLTGSGGIAAPSELVRNPLLSLDSGPALAPVAGRFYATAEFDAEDVITCDMGGTSFDVTRVTAGEIAVTRDFRIGHERLNIAKVDCRTIGAGGGSIARVDEGGLLHVGPESAGSVPGPACYCGGGSLPTVTDAALQLGYYDESYFLGGAMPLSRELAAEAIEAHVGSRLRLDVDQAAFAIWSTVCASMTEAIREITVKVGIDPSEYVFVAGGGAAGAHIGPIVEGLRGKAIIVPRTAGTLSAFGGAIGDVVREFNRSFFTNSDDFDFDAVNTVMRGLEDEATAFLKRCGVAKDLWDLQYFVEARYQFQDRELTIPLPHPRIESIGDVRRVVEAFHDMHDKTLGSCEEGGLVEFVMWTVRAVGRRGMTPGAVRENASCSASEALRGQRKVFFDELGRKVTTPIYDGALLAGGSMLDGPAVIEEPTTSIVVFPGHAVRVSELGNYLMTVL